MCCWLYRFIIWKQYTLNEARVLPEGLPLEGNVYYYLLKVKFVEQEEQEELYKGDVTLIR